MIKIIKDNTLKQVMCPRCTSLLEYDGIKDPFCDDIRYDSTLKSSIYSWYINCPKCGHRIKVEERQSRG
jgi:DNA-directed RNA polymerase subunit RPC12/RpoP